MSSDQPTEATRFGLVGAGAIAQTYGQAFPRCNAAWLVAVADVRGDAADALAAATDCRGFASYQVMADSTPLDAVVVSTPPATHPQIAEYFLRRGVHVLCEKPLAIDSESAQAMIACGQHHQAKLTMASKFRFVPDLIQAKAIIASGILGEIVLFENTFAAPVDMRERWNSQVETSGGGVLIDNGTHSVDIMRYLFGPIAEIYAQRATQVQDIDVEDTVELSIRTANDVMGRVSLSWSIKKEAPYYVTIYGKQGTLLVGWAESKYRRSPADGWIVFGDGYDKIRAFRDQIDNFARVLQGHDALRITDIDAMASVQVVEAAYCSLDSDARVPVEPGWLAAHDG